MTLILINVNNKLKYLYSKIKYLYSKIKYFMIYKREYYPEGENFLQVTMDILNNTDLAGLPLEILLKALSNRANWKIYPRIEMSRLHEGYIAELRSIHKDKLRKFKGMDNPKKTIIKDINRLEASILNEMKKLTNAHKKKISSRPFYDKVNNALIHLESLGYCRRVEFRENVSKRYVYYDFTETPNKFKRVRRGNLVEGNFKKKHG